MNLSEQQLENLLRRAPAPVPPPSLESELRRTIPAAAATSRPNHQELPAEIASSPARTGAGSRGASGSGLRRWWPVLLPGLAATAFAAGWVLQQIELGDLREELHVLAAQAESASAVEALAGGIAPAANVQPDATGRQDLERLRALLKQLSEEVAALEAGQAETERLRAALKALEAALPKDVQEAQVFSERASAIQCVNNMKQLGLAVRVWATDNEDDFPPNLLSMTNELSTPKVLVCPSDETRSAAADWASYSDAAHSSYEFLSPGPGKFENEPNRVLFRCPIHGNITLCDGSVQMAFAKNHPDRLQLVNGAWYMLRDDPGAFVVPGGAGSAPEGGVTSDATSAAASGGSMPAGVQKALQSGARMVLPLSMAQRYGITLQPGATTSTNEQGEVWVEMPTQPAAETPRNP